MSHFPWKDKDLDNDMARFLLGRLHDSHKNRMPMDKKKNKLIRVMKIGKGTSASKQPENTRSLKQYFKDLRKDGTLKKEEEAALLKRYMESDNEDERIAIRNRIVTSNQKLIYAIAKRYALGEHTMDIVGEATITICRNFDKFRPDEGFTLLTWMSHEVRRTANEYLCRDACHIKQTQNEKILPKARKVYNKFFLEHGYYPDQQTVRDIIEDEYGIKVSKDVDMVDYDLYSIDAMHDEESEHNDKSATYRTLEIVAATDNDYEKESEQEDIKMALNLAMGKLDDREKKIISMSSGTCGYYREYDNNEIGDELGLTSERVRQIKKGATDKMAKTLTRLGLGLTPSKRHKEYAAAYT